MRTRSYSWLAWPVAALAVLLVGLAIFLAALNQAGTLGEKVINGVVVSMPYPIVGALILSRTDGNPIGWVFCAVGLFQGLNVFCDEYAHYALITDPGSLPGGFELGWVAFWTWMPSLALLVTALLLYFPTGHPPSPRWTWVDWLSRAGIALIVIPTAIAAWSARETGLETLHPNGVNVNGDILVLVPAGFAFVLIGALASVTSLVLRFRRSQGEERLQLKWFMLAGSFTLATVLFAFTPLKAGEWALPLGLLAIPVAVGVSVLKYRLYDIDRLINRTLVYGSVTVLLALVYGGLVLLLGNFVTIIGPNNSIAVAVATLAVAALFTPLRSQVQAFIDRRFYRSKYDAKQIIETFNTHLRDEVDLEVLAGELTTVIRRTMHPSTMSVWLRPAKQTD